MNLQQMRCVCEIVRQQLNVSAAARSLSTSQPALTKQLKQLEDEFPERFIRIHRNALAAVAHIAGIEKDNLGHCYLKLRHSDEKLEISRRLLPDVRRHLKN